MSNRVLGFLIILIFILFGTAFFMYAFLYNSSKFILNSSIDNYSAELYNKKTFKKYDFSCPGKKCILDDIPPFSYKLTLTKEGYKQIVKQVALERNEKKNIKIIFQKDIKLEEVFEEKKKEIINKNSHIIPLEKDNKNSITENNNSKLEKKLTNKERIRELINRKNKIKNSLKKIDKKIKLENSKNKKYLFLNKIDLFINTDKTKIKVLETNGNKNIFFIENENKKYIYNKSTANIEKIDLNIPVIYLKNNSNFSVNLVTKKGTFAYSLKNKKIKYFSLFKDYINYKGNYIGIIDSSDKTRKTNFGFKNKKENLIIFYNRKDFSKKIIYKNNKEIKKILLKNNNIFIIDSDNKKFKLKNFD